MSAEVIRIVGARQNNLKDLALDLPLHELIVITGVSGSGKSSLAFDTLYAEGQRISWMNRVSAGTHVTAVVWGAFCIT